jgi:hypothetical protein
MLGRCDDLDLGRPITVRVVDSLPAECPTDALGYFNPRDRTVTIPTYPACVALTEPDGRLGRRMSPELYDSLIAHELAHAIVSGCKPVEQMSRAVREYLANAIQFSAMESALRADILARYAHPDPVRFEELSALYLDLAPARFAVKSYLHFQTLDDPCAFIDDLIEGRRTLRSGMR